MNRSIRRSACLGALLCALTTAALAQDVSWVNPEALPSVLKQPLSLFATTDPKHDGSDYRILPPGGKATIATIAGPAIIFRLWSTSSDNTNLVVDMTRDGQTERLYGKDTLPPEAAEDDPLRSLDGEAYWSYVPLAVRRQATFTARNLDLKHELKVFLQVGSRQASPQDLAEVTRRNVQEMRETVRFALKDPTLAGRGQAMAGTVTPDAPWTTTLAKPGLIRVMALDMGEGGFEQMAATRLRLTVDGQVTVDVPLGALFCQYWKLEDYSSVATAVRGRRLILRFPMPVAESLSVSLASYNGRPLEALAVGLHVQDLPQPPQYRFCAQYFSVVSVRGQPLRLARIAGQGILLGANLAVDGLNHRSFAFLEGNEQIYVDGATKPTYEGTGTEDFFNGAWYFEAGKLTRAFHGVTLKQDTQPPRVSCYRYLVPDCVAFKSGLTLDLQHGSRNSSPDTLYRAVVFWYQKPPVTVAEPAEAKVTPEKADAGTDAPGPGVPVVPLVIGAVVVLTVVLGLLWWRRR